MAGPCAGRRGQHTHANHTDSQRALLPRCWHSLLIIYILSLLTYKHSGLGLALSFDRFHSQECPGTSKKAGLGRGVGRHFRLQRGSFERKLTQAYSHCCLGSWLTCILQGGRLESPGARLATAHTMVQGGVGKGEVQPGPLRGRCGISQQGERVLASGLHPASFHDIPRR